MTVIGTIKVDSLKPVHTRDSNNIYGNDLGKDLQSGQVVNVIAQAPPSNNLFPNSSVDVWYQLEDSSWTCGYYKFTGYTYCSFTPIVPPSPVATPAQPIKDTIILDDGSIWVSTNFTKIN